MDDETIERVRAAVLSIPAGQVATYGDVADVSRAPSPRLVGRVLSEDGHDLPWHRVLRANGTCAPHLAREQLALLRAEGVLADGERVNLREYRWEAVPPPEEPPSLF
ncbi:alkylated DNA nucleotide flippase Atl1 [Crossiella equi]|uniref:Alkylated DNA nucleotide flippase Atl1 n=1 Tax=Crossiella equi TaxID=130796 RepID=A0ABS5AJ01_9PSEU|nr:MGMT family protein [Crossiella equi]MBP2476558.1 alkylated DNA nucleotide flippase Atl1 [Crossiella equi]